MTPVSARRGAFYVSVAATAWGTGGAAGSLLFQSGGLGPVGVSLWRYLLGAAFLLALTRLTGGRLDRFSPRVVVVGLGMAVYQTAYFASIAESGVAVATVVTMGATPVLTALGGRILLRERLGRVGLTALAAALAGLALLTGEAAVEGGGGLAGIAFALLSAAGYAGVTVFSRRHQDDPQGTAVGGFLVGAICLMPFALAEGVLPELNLPSVALLLYLGAVPTALAYGLFFRALTALDATTVSVISLVEAAGAAVLGVVLFGERLSPLAWGGCALLSAAVVVLTARAGSTAGQA
ncbi:DMT family transporter [Nonomuraea cavernae]|uniref:Membrane protein n=1 Tax=Nonomuraea cavernae TaxID=2045107 RepID=A0A918DHF7_9ACTN|nr:EamA family transporter [Nonomuraea cavernae]MCA2185100.1 DMT family transporter [Nonomuraea cavernae]GGO65411.1 membrane protein [Nonomuraea cavernae]